MAEKYGIESLAFAVHKLRRAGYPVESKLKRDDWGRRYAAYRLVKENSGQLSAA